MYIEMKKRNSKTNISTGYKCSDRIVREKEFLSTYFENADPTFWKCSNPELDPTF